MQAFIFQSFLLKKFSVELIIHWLSGKKRIYLIICKVMFYKIRSRSCKKGYLQTPLRRPHW